MKTTEIRRQIYHVYGEIIMSALKMRKLVKAFKDVCTNMHDEEQNWSLLVITEDLVQRLENSRLTI